MLQVEQQQVWVTWTQVDTLAGAGPSDTVYLLDAAGGTLTCGDTLRGMAFPTGARVRALSYRFGGGSAGNVAPGAISTIDSGTAVVVANPLALEGGADAETIDQAMTRIPAELSNHDRAVTAGDFAALAAIQGVGRAECLPCFYPPTPGQQAAGVVTVVVWPSADTLHPLAPTPDQALLSEVCARLDARRLVTTELYVVPPTYHQVAVSMGVHAQAGYSGNAITTWVSKVIQQYLSPLPPFGPSGGGWPLGRNVIGPELMAVALQVEGIDYLEPVQLADLDQSGAWQPADLRHDRAAALGGGRAVLDHRGDGHAARPRKRRPGSARAELDLPHPRPARAVLSMPAARALATICTTDQWLRCSHSGTAIDLASGEVSLAWQQPPGATWSGTGVADPAGLDFDPGGCLYHGDLPDGQVQWIAWQPATRSRCAASSPQPVDLLADPGTPSFGQFAAASSPPRPALVPSSIAVDLGQHLYVLDGATGTIWVFDLDRPGRVPARRRSPRRPAASPARAPPCSSRSRTAASRCSGSRRAVTRSRSRCPPAALAGSTRTRSRSRSQRREPAGSGCCGGRPPARAGRCQSQRRRAGQARRRAARSRGPAASRSTARATWSSPARPATTSCPSRPPTASAPRTRRSCARNYDGRGIVTTPDGRIGYWTSRGSASPSPPASAYARCRVRRRASSSTRGATSSAGAGSSSTPASPTAPRSASPP